MQVGPLQFFERTLRSNVTWLGDGERIMYRESRVLEPNGNTSSLFKRRMQHGGLLPNNGTTPPQCAPSLPPPTPLPSHSHSRSSSHVKTASPSGKVVPAPSGAAEREAFYADRTAAHVAARQGGVLQRALMSNLRRLQTLAGQALGGSGALSADWPAVTEGPSTITGSKTGSQARSSSLSYSHSYSPTPARPQAQSPSGSPSGSPSDRPYAADDDDSADELCRDYAPIPTSVDINDAITSVYMPLLLLKNNGMLDLISSAKTAAAASTSVAPDGSQLISPVLASNATRALIAKALDAAAATGASFSLDGSGSSGGDDVSIGLEDLLFTRRSVKELLFGWEDVMYTAFNEAHPGVTSPSYPGLLPNGSLLLWEDNPANTGSGPTTSGWTVAYAGRPSVHGGSRRVVSYDGMADLHCCVGGPCGGLVNVSAAEAQPAWGAHYANKAHGYDSYHTIGSGGVQPLGTLPILNRHLGRVVHGWNPPGPDGRGLTASHKGINSLRFIIAPIELMTSSDFPPNAVYHQDGPFGGLANITNCASRQPLFVSKPMFLDGNESLPASVGLPQGVRVLHDTAYDVEPNSGLVIGVHERVQLNVYLDQYGGQPGQHHDPGEPVLFPGLQPVYVPLMWVDRHAEVNWWGAYMYHTRYLDALASADRLEVGLYFMSGLCVLLASTIALLTMRQRGRDFLALHASSVAKRIHDAMNGGGGGGSATGAGQEAVDNGDSSGGGHVSEVDYRFIDDVDDFDGHDETTAAAGGQAAGRITAGGVKASPVRGGGLIVRLLSPRRGNSSGRSRAPFDSEGVELTDAVASSRAAVFGGYVLGEEEAIGLHDHDRGVFEGSDGHMQHMPAHRMQALRYGHRVPHADNSMRDEALHPHQRGQRTALHADTSATRRAQRATTTSGMAIAAGSNLESEREAWDLNALPSYMARLMTTSSSPSSLHAHQHQ